MQNETKNQPLYLIQFLATICVVIIHSGTIIENSIAHFIIKSLLCRVAVPFFLINNAFFFRINSRKKDYSREWLERILTMYLFVFILYFPFGVQFLQNTAPIHWSLMPLIVIVSFFYCGSFYHLWYFPALISSIFMVEFLLKKIGYRKGILLCFLLFAVGSVETYSVFIENSFLKSILKNYFTIFLTTRNGLFFSPVFVLIGYYLADKKDRLLHIKNKLKCGLFMSLVFSVFEGIIVYNHQGIDKNFMYFSLLFTPCIFSLLLISKSDWRDLRQLKYYSQGIFIFHMIPIQLFNNHHLINNSQRGLTRLFLGVVIPIGMIYIFRAIRKTIFRTNFVRIK